MYICVRGVDFAIKGQFENMQCPLKGHYRLLQSMLALLFLLFAPGQ